MSGKRHENKGVASASRPPSLLMVATYSIKNCFYNRSGSVLNTNTSHSLRLASAAGYAFYTAILINLLIHSTKGMCLPCLLSL